MLFAKIDTAAATDLTLVTGVAGKKIVVCGYAFVVAGTTNITWKSGTTALSGAMPFVANGGLSSPTCTPSAIEPDAGVLQCAAGESLIITNSAAVQLSGHIAYVFAPG